jgi:hypothetical protein
MENWWIFWQFSIIITQIFNKSWCCSIFCFLYSVANNKNYSSVAITNKSDIAEKRIEDSHG